MNLKREVNPFLAIGIIASLAFLTVLFYFTHKSEDVADHMATTTNKRTIMQYKSATLETSKGNIEIEFFTDKAPNTVANFIKLAEQDFYDNTKFHRVIKGFMIQGGDPLTKNDNTDGYGTGGPNYTFNDEINDEKLVKGVIAMANRGPNTNGSQFFIITAVSTPWLDGKHTAFGKVVKGMDIVNAIENSQTGDRDIPLQPIVVKSVQLR